MEFKNTDEEHHEHCCDYEYFCILGRDAMLSCISEKRFVSIIREEKWPTLKKKIDSSETSAMLYHTTWRHNRDDYLHKT
jgi:hypothetical protein